MRPDIRDAAYLRERALPARAAAHAQHYVRTEELTE
jgi:hypothetical protein